MRVGLVSTYPPKRCAIGLYTQNLARALVADPDSSVFVCAENTGEPEDLGLPRLQVRAAYRREDDYGDDVFRAITAERCEVAHFQYAPDLFGEDRRLPALVKRLRAAGVRPVVTLHTVYGARRWRALALRPSTRAFHRELARAAHLVVHHREAMATELERQGISPGDISVIPHGTTRAELPPMSDARARLGIPEDAFLFTFFGFIHRLKNVHTAVEGFLRAASKMPDARLLVSGMPWGDRWYNHLYVGAIKARVSLAPAAPRVSIRDEYLAAERVPDVYAASDVILLPHQQSYGSASGVFHQAVGFGRPMLSARGPKFAEARALFRDLPDLMVPAGSARAWARAMTRIYESPDLRRRALEAVESFAERTSWPVVGREHLAVYRRLVG